MKRLAEWRKERRDRCQAPNGSATRLRDSQAGTNARGAEGAHGWRGAITARSVRWFRRISGHAGTMKSVPDIVTNQEADAARGQ
jgi:hypothetical protein